MKLKLSLFLLISVFLTGNLFALNNEPEGFAELKWGEAIQPSFNILYTSEAGSNKYDLCIKPGEKPNFLGETFDRIFYSFVNSRFFRVKYSKKDTQEFCNKLKEALKTSLGADPEDDTVDTMLKYRWSGKLVKVLLEFNSEEGEVTLIISSLKTSEYMNG
ncbi:MAG: hypothetical protein GY714_00765 [Desulfobacterales bacterium]|nr:hypothetical protein [Desulfobacterales bacterium]MCP4159255.1 hypothetical protein [Deltaproteobacteria bacterium]